MGSVIFVRNLSYSVGPPGLKGEQKMRKAKFLKATLAVALILAMLCGSAMAARSAKVFSSSMAIYNSKSTNNQIGSLSHGSSFSVTSISGSWAKISYKGNTCYAKLSDIVFSKRVKVVSTKSTPIKFITKKSFKNRTYYTATLAPGTTLYVAGINGSYYLFYDETGSAMGYVSKSAVRKAG